MLDGFKIIALKLNVLQDSIIFPIFATDLRKKNEKAFERKPFFVAKIFNICSLEKE